MPVTPQEETGCSFGASFSAALSAPSFWALDNAFAFVRLAELGVAASVCRAWRGAAHRAPKQRSSLFAFGAIEMRVERRTPI